MLSLSLQNFQLPATLETIFIQFFFQPVFQKHN